MEEKDFSAGLIHQVASPLAGTQPRPNSELEQRESDLYAAIKILVGNPSAAQLAWSNIDDAVLNLEAAVRSEGKWSDADVIVMLRNSGVDVECGACMEIAFTGITTNVHSCAPRMSRHERLVIRDCPCEDGKPDPCPKCGATAADGVCGG